MKGFIILFNPDVLSDSADQLLNGLVLRIVLGRYQVKLGVELVGHALRLIDIHLPLVLWDVCLGHHEVNSRLPGVVDVQIGMLEVPELLERGEVVRREHKDHYLTATGVKREQRSETLTTCRAPDVHLHLLGWQILRSIRVKGCPNCLLISIIWVLSC